MSELALFGGDPAVRNGPIEVWPAFDASDARVVAEMVLAGEVSYLGEEGWVKRLEDAMRQQTGAPHALAVNSGTAALHSAYFGLEIWPGDEVIVPTYTHHATVMPLFALNATPVLADADAETGNVDPTSIERVITPRTKAIVVMHLNGHAVDMPRIMAIARRYGLKVVEDCSQAHGAECCDRPIGSFGDVAAFSLQSRKQVVAGAGGILTTNDTRIFERAVMLGHSLDRAEQDVTSEELRRFATTGAGLNLRMHPMAAALATRSLSRLDGVLETRAANAQRLDDILEQLPGVCPPINQAHMTRVARYSYQPLYRAHELGGLAIETFVSALAAEGVPIGRPRTPPLHNAPAFQDRGWRSDLFGPSHRIDGRTYADGDLPASERYFATALRMPVFTEDVGLSFADFASAFEKVIGHADRLRDLDPKG